jgi:BolA family transcriptional regulator, general stress-responsive regulator
LKVDAAAIEAVLRAGLEPLALSVEDDSHHHRGHAGAREGGHYTVRVRSARFTGLTPVARHRLVYDILGPLMAGGIHALAIETRAPEDA